MNYPVDSLGKLRITEILFDGDYAHLEFNYLSGYCRTSATYKRGLKNPVKIDHFDEFGINAPSVEFIMNENSDTIIEYIMAKREEKPGKTDFSMEQLQAMPVKKIEKLARFYNINTEGKTMQQTAYAIFDAQIDSRD